MAFAEETPSGVMNSINDTFSIVNTPLTGSFRLYLNGLKLFESLDYTLTGTTLVMFNIPHSTDSLIAKYKY